ncbi:MAG TPA: ferritin, partial [Desulfoprunum sp.]|nr:ferritin [Desulfoprunum sp.]
MISDKLNDALNGQINAELYSSYLYLSMSAWFSARSLPGFATWMRCQAQEELFHATKMFDYLNERGGTVVLETIAKPD